MKRNELHYRKVHRDSFAPPNQSHQPHPRGSANADIEARIVALYTDGMSIESITREVGRARHLVVHVLHSRGVFRTGPSLPDWMEPVPESVASPSSDGGEPLDEESTGSAVEAQATVVSRDAGSATAARPRRFKASKTRGPRADANADPGRPIGAQKPAAESWSPQVVDALFEVVTQVGSDAGLSMDDVHRLVSRRRRSQASRG